MRNLSSYREDFPILKRKIRNNNLVFLDNSATTQKPIQVIDAISDYYKNYNSNIHRSVYTLGDESEKIYEESKELVKNFINAQSYEEIIYTSGTTESINFIVRMLEQDINEGDEVILTYMEHHANIIPWQQLALRKNLTLKYLEFDKEGKINLKQLEEYITEKTKVVSICHASNVLGTINPVYKIGDLLKDKNIYLISDEIYAAITFEKFTSFAKFSDELKEQLIIINGFSKSHSMTGYRLGYIIADEKLQNQVKKVSQYNVTSASTLSQYGAIAALDKCSDTTKISEIYKKRVEYFVNGLEKLGFEYLKPKGAFYVFATYKNIEKFKNVKSFDFVLDLLEKTELAIVPGITFQVEGYVRFSIVHDIPVLEEAIARLGKYIKEK